MIDYIYEVRFPQNPDPSFTQKFSTKQEAISCAQDNPGSEVYMVELDYDDYMGARGIGEFVNEIQIVGPEIDAALKSGEDGLNSCSADDPNNYDAAGKFRAPVMDDDVEMTDEELGEALFSAVSKGCCKKDLAEDSAGMVDDSYIPDGEEVCVWCGERFPISALKFERDLGYICDRCQAAIASHEGDDALEL